MGKAKPVDLLEKARTNPKSVKHLCLNPGALQHEKILYEPTPAFPVEVLACTNLQTLDLFRGIAWDGDNRIPEAIGKLKKLTHLTLGGLTMKTLPNAIGNLTKLVELSLDYAESLKSLPKTIGKLKNLEELALSYCTELKKLPKEIGKLKKVRTLSLSDTAVKKVPKELWEMKSLASLSLSEMTTSLPPGIAKLASLESLSLSAPALVSIASELPKLKKLTTLYVYQGEDGELPEQIGELPKLQSLHCSFAGIAKLPASLAGHRVLAELDVAGNQIESLEALAASLPKLETLDFSDNPIDRAEKRRIDAMMKLSPKKRKANAPAPKSSGDKAKLVGQVTSINASLVMLVADANVAKDWRGVDEGDEEESDFDRMLDAMGGDEYAKLKVGKADALGLSLQVGQGIVRVFRSGETLVLVEGFVDEDDDPTFLEDMALPPEKKAVRAGSVAIPSGKLVLMPSTDACSDVAKKSPPKEKGLECGSEDCGLLLKVQKGTHRILLEDEKNASWGTARRALIVPSQ